MSQEINKPEIPTPEIATGNTPDTLMSNLVATRMNKEVENIVSGNNSLSEREYILPSFVTQKNGGVFVCLNDLLNPESFRMFLNSIFKTGHYFLDTNYQDVMRILYDFESVEEFQKDRATFKSTVIKIASDIKKFDQIRISLYREPKISDDKKSASYLFDPVYIEETKEDGKIEEVRTKINFDEFIAAIWNHGVQFGLDIESINKGINENQIARFTIANGRDSIPGTDAAIEPVISFEIKRGVKENNKSRADILIYEQSYIRVEKDTSVYRKKNLEYGKVGRNVVGGVVEPTTPLDLSLDTYAGIGVRCETIDGVDFIISNDSGFPRLEEGTVQEGRKLVKRICKIHVDEMKTFDEGIGMLTGKVATDNDVCSVKTIILDTKGRIIVAKKDLEANIHASENVVIEGNIFGNIQGNLSSGIVSKGQVVSDNGNINVTGHINNSYLEAKKGVVHISHVVNSIIIAKRVEISGDVFNCTIVANEIVIEGKTIGSRVMSDKSIDVRESTDKGGFENAFYLFSLDLKASIDAKEEAIKNEEKMIEETKNKIDAFILSNFPKIITIIQDKEKRFLLTDALMGILNNPKSIDEEKNKPYIGIFQKMEPILKKNIHWSDLQKNKLAIVKLSEEIKVEQAIMEESTQKKLCMDIKDIKGPTYIQLVKFQQNKKFLELKMEEIDHMSKLMAGRDVSPICALEIIPAPTIGGFSWKSTPIEQEEMGTAGGL